MSTYHQLDGKTVHFQKENAELFLAVREYPQVFQMTVVANLGEQEDRVQVTCQEMEFNRFHVRDSHGLVSKFDNSEEALQQALKVAENNVVSKWKVAISKKTKYAESGYLGLQFSLTSKLREEQVKREYAKPKAEKHFVVWNIDVETVRFLEHARGVCTAQIQAEAIDRLFKTVGKK